MATLTLAESMFNVIDLHTVMLGVCISTPIAYIIVREESIPVACLIQQEGTLMSMLGYIVMTTPVSSCYCADYTFKFNHSVHADQLF